MTHKQDLLNIIVKSLRTRPETWRWDGNSDPSHIIHDSGVKLWIYSGSARLWQPDVRFGFEGRLRLRLAFRYWRKASGNSAAKQLEDRRVIEALIMLGFHPEQSL